MPADSKINKFHGETPSSEPSKSLERKDNGEKFSESKETATQAAEALELGNGVENVDGRVTEVLGKGNEQKGDGPAGGKSMQAKKDSRDKVMETLLSRAPNESVMRTQIEREIKNEIDYLHNKAMKMMRSSAPNYFQVTNIVKRIRELEGLLVELVKASVEKIKTLWLRFKHGIM